MVPPLDNLFDPFILDGAFEAQFWAPLGQTYILQVSADLLHWTSIATNTPTAVPFTWSDPDATNATRFYRVVAP